MSDAEQSQGYEQAMTRPIERPTFAPDYTIEGPHRARWRRALEWAIDFLVGFGTVAVFFLITRLALRFLGVI